jgi:CheY-like chemotaxis protein
MKARELRALLIGESCQGSAHLVKLLEGHGCECSFATSYQEACSLLGARPFDLVLSPIRLRDCSIFPLVGLLQGSGVTLFYFQLVEDGCWWLPALRSGRACFGSHALRPSEFVVSLNEIVAELRAGSRAPAENQPALASTTQTSVTTGSRSGASARLVAA